MAPLHPPGQNENGEVANLYPAFWICTSKNESKQGTIGNTAMYNVCTRHQNPLLSGKKKRFPDRQVQGIIFFMAVKFLKNENKKRV